MDPMPGASTCARGSHLCQGIRGVFIAKARNSPRNSCICMLSCVLFCCSAVLLKVPVLL